MIMPIEPILFLGTLISPYAIVCVCVCVGVVTEQFLLAEIKQ